MPLEIVVDDEDLQPCDENIQLEHSSEAPQFEEVAKISASGSSGDVRILLRSVELPDADISNSKNGSMPHVVEETKISDKEF